VLWYCQEKNPQLRAVITVITYIQTHMHAHTHTHIYTHKTWVEFWLFMHFTSFWHWFWGKCNSEEPNTTGKSMPKIRKCLTWRKRCKLTHGFDLTQIRVWKEEGGVQGEERKRTKWVREKNIKKRVPLKFEREFSVSFMWVLLWLLSACDYLPMSNTLPRLYFGTKGKCPISKSRKQVCKNKHRKQLRICH